MPGQYGFVGSVASWAGASAAFDAVFDPERDDINDIVAFPIEKVTRRVSVDYWWLGTFTDGTSVKPGKYKYVPPRHCLLSASWLVTDC